jgi:hypothetical protein
VVERITVNFMFASATELRAAGRKQARLENAGYVLVSHTGNTMVYRLPT